jgi:adenylate kinase
MEHLDMGAILRLRATRGDATGQRIHRTQIRGEMVPKELVLQVLNEHLARHLPERILVLDGFPRTRAQLAATEDGRVPIAIDRAIWLDVPRDVAESRLRVRAGIEPRNDDAASTLRFALMDETVDAVRRELVTRGVLEVVDATLDADTVFSEVSSLLAPLVAHS